jgi:hypothetical protein
VAEGLKAGFESVDQERELEKVKDDLAKDDRDHKLTKEQRDALEQKKTDLENSLSRKSNYTDPVRSQSLPPDVKQAFEDARNLRQLQYNQQKQAEEAAQNPKSRKEQTQKENADKLFNDAKAQYDQKYGQQYALPGLPTGTSSAGASTTGSGQVEGKVEGQVFDSSWKTVGWAQTVGAAWLPEEHVKSLDNSQLQQRLRENPLDGNTPKAETDGEGKFKLNLKYNFDKPKYGLDLKYTVPAPSTDGTGFKPIQPEAPAPPKTPTDQSSRSTGFNLRGDYSRLSYVTAVGLRCDYTRREDRLSDMWLDGGTGGPLTLKVGNIPLNSTIDYDVGFTSRRNREWVPGAMQHAKIPADNLTIDDHRLGDIGAIGNLRVTEADAEAFPAQVLDWLSSGKPADDAFVELVRTGTVFVEKGVCFQIAPAPSWDPAHWPTGPATSPPTLRLNRSDLHE